MQGLDWYWIGLQLSIAPIVGFLIAIPFWRKSSFIFGNIAGSGIMLGCAIANILREYVVVDRVVKACLDAGTTCFPEPSADLRFAISASIGLGEMFLLFTVSLMVERRMDNREYAVEWRR